MAKKIIKKDKPAVIAVKKPVETKAKPVVKAPEAPIAKAKPVVKAPEAPIAKAKLVVKAPEVPIVKAKLVVKAPEAPIAKAKLVVKAAVPVKKAATKAKKVRSLARGKTVKADVKGTKKHEVKKTGDIIRFKHKKHPEREGAHLINVHGVQTEGGLQLITPSTQSSVSASLRAREDVAAGSEFVFATAKDFISE
jgi:hypothetical protein